MISSSWAGVDMPGRISSLRMGAHTSCAMPSAVPPARGRFVVGLARLPYFCLSRSVETGGSKRLRLRACAEDAPLRSTPACPRQSNPPAPRSARHDPGSPSSRGWRHGRPHVNDRRGHSNPTWATVGAIASALHTCRIDVSRNRRGRLLADENAPRLGQLMHREERSAYPPSGRKPQLPKLT
jgi:hypothetical protein